MINPDRCNLSTTREGLFWPRLLSDEALERCENLEKLLAGCEIIAALDGLDLLAA